MKYGLPYQGSKKKLADKILAKLPPAENFYDLFAGGCAITNAAMITENMFGRQYQNIYCNDIQNTPQLFLDAINGKYKNEKRWISREDFISRKDTDPYIKWIWSFGNNGKDYMFSKNVEELKRLAHLYLFNNGYDGTPESRIQLVKQFKSDKNVIACFELERLERLERLEISCKDYREVFIKPNSVIYCDPPYENTRGYGVDFNHVEFWDWVCNNQHPVYVSEYKAPDDMQCIAEFEHRSTLSANANNKVIEKLFWNGK